MEYLSGEAIVGFFVAVGGVAIVLQRFGILKLPTKRNNSGSDKIVGLEKVQEVQAERIEQHDERLDKGDKRFEKLETTINNINVNVGVLLERTK